MNQGCREQAQLMVAYLKEELHPLERTRLESHLANCGRCSELRQQLARSFAVATAWSPEVDHNHLERLISRLTPYLEQPAPRPRFTFGLGLAGAALAAAALFAIALRTPEPAPIATPVIARTDLGRISPTSFVRMVTSSDWDGQIETPSAGNLRIQMNRGFAAVDFTGGDGRTLEIDSPGVIVEVVGTRFFVEVPSGGGASVVGVAHGRVRVRTPRRTDLLDAGSSRIYLASGEPSAQVRPAAAVEHLGDQYLDAPAIAALAEPAAAPEAAPATLAPPAPPAAVRQLFARAEALARRGKPRAALAIYRSIADSNREADEPFRPIARYEIARLYGFTLGERDRADQLLRELAEAGSGEVATEAGFARCELQLAVSPCASAACLKSIAAHGPPAVSTEARHLLVRWQLDVRACRDQKSDSSDRPKE